MNSSSSLSINIFIIFFVFILYNANINEAIITNLSQQQLSKLEQCSNETYVCVKDSMDEQEIYCCCNQKWSNCRRTLSCEDYNAATSTARYHDDCRFLSTYERYFKRTKNKNCTTLLPDLQCNSGQQIMASFIIGNGNFQSMIIMIIIFIITFQFQHL